VVVASTAKFHIIKRCTLLPEWFYMLNMAATKDNDSFPRKHLPVSLYNAGVLYPPRGISEFFYTIYGY
jgi:hypothetical protein